MSNLYLQGLLHKLPLYIHYYHLLVQAHHGHSLPFKHHCLPSSTTASYHFIVVKVFSPPSPLHSEWSSPALGVAEVMRGDRLTAFNSVFTRQVAATLRSKSKDLEYHKFGQFSGQKVAILPTKGLLLMFNSKACQQHKECVSCMTYYHAEGLFYTGSGEKYVKAWRISDSRCMDSFLAHEYVVNATMANEMMGVFSLARQTFLSRFGDDSLTLTMTLKFQTSPESALAISTSLSSCFFYSVSSDGFINFSEKENFSGFLQGHRFVVLCLVALEKLVYGREEGSYFHECLVVLDAYKGPVRCLAAVFEIEKVMMGGFWCIVLAWTRLSMCGESRYYLMKKGVFGWCGPKERIEDKS
ncbi:hypothetical protein RJ640_013569 [Escallonia rubra]|uniref:Uncharacterized protein n=1 Tax=Escallonia rubra TaxID=112253 RepID=A0AA88QL73_9ASTE|nr:hypothetical protein RJ640_013569 [Escallonia rubra]